MSRLYLTVFTFAAVCLGTELHAANCFWPDSIPCADFDWDEFSCDLECEPDENGFDVCPVPYDTRVTANNVQGRTDFDLGGPGYTQWVVGAEVICTEKRDCSAFCLPPQIAGEPGLCASGGGTWQPNDKRNHYAVLAGSPECVN